MIGLIILAVTPVIVYYVMSYNSVHGSTVQIALASRSLSRNFFNSVESVSYYIEVHVWLYATSIDTRVHNPTFSLFVDSYPIARVDGGSGTFKPNSYLIYSLTFITFDATGANAIGQSASYRLILGMDALVTAGWYQEQLTTSDSRTQTFSG